MAPAPSPARPRPARQPSRLSVVSSALSSAGSDDDDDDQLDGMDPEGEVDDEMDDLSEDEVDEENSADEDESYADDSRASSIMPKSNKGRNTSKAPARDKASSAAKHAESSKSPLKITLKSRGPPAKATAASARPSRAVVQNNRGKKIIESDEDDDEEDEAEDADMTPGVGEDEDDNEEMDELGDVSGPGMDSGILTPDPDGDGEEEEDDDDDESALLNNLPKTARQLAKAGFGEELVELPMSDDSRKLKRTAAEIALKRSETARRRRYQSEKKLDDEKTETINRLLKKQVGRKSTRELKKENAAARAKRAKRGADGADGGDGEENGNVDDEEDDDDDEGDGDGADRSRKQAGGRGELTRAQEKDLPLPLFRTVIRADRTLVSVPVLPAAAAATTTAAEGGTLGQVEDQGPYMRRWATTFGTGSAAIQVIEGAASAKGEEAQAQPVPLQVPS